jgi:flavorubredoxin
MIAEIKDIETTCVGELDAAMAKSAAVVVGSPTINQNILFPIYKLFSVINPIRDKKKVAGGFGSYGWSGEGKTIIEANLKSLKLNYLEDGMYVKFTPGEKDLLAAEDYGEAIAKAILGNRQ